MKYYKILYITGGFYIGIYKSGKWDRFYTDYTTVRRRLHGLIYYPVNTHYLPPNVFYNTDDIKGKTPYLFSNTTIHEFEIEEFEDSNE